MPKATKVQLPPDLSSESTVRRVLSSIIESIDEAFGFRGDDAFARSSDLLQALPPKSVILYAGADAPSGWRICNGTVYTTNEGRITSPDLASKAPAGTIYIIKV